MSDTDHGHHLNAHTPLVPTTSADPPRERIEALCAEAADERRYLNGALVVYADDVRAIADPAWRNARLAFHDGDWPAPNFALLNGWNDPANKRPPTRGNLRDPDGMPPETQRDCADHHYVGELHQQAYNAHLILDLLGVPGLESATGGADLDDRVSVLAQQFAVISDRLDRIEGWHSHETGEHGTVGDYCNECGHLWPCDTQRMAEGTYVDEHEATP